MKRTSAILQILICVLVGLSMNRVSAAPVDTLVAKQVASRFIQSRTADAPQRSNVLKLVYTATYQSRATSRSANCLYIYSTGKGFVIVTADDRLMPILGYSDEGNFDMEDIPENMQQMLNFYMDEIQQYLNQAEAQPNAATEEWQKFIRGTYTKSSRSGGRIGPLLNTTWDQNSPYNNLCPVDTAGPGGHAYGGCVATAMAQVMRYWEYPLQGVGSYSYESNYSNYGYGDYGVLSVNFGVGSYNYSLMPNYISSSTPSNQITAIARLIYHCGVSVGMMYGIDGSGGSTYTACSSLAQYFKYSTSYGTLTPQYKYKSTYSSDDWVALIKNELDNWRPVIYDGQGTGGHAFVCDGYDDQGYFHFNWGWSGSYNGYYLLSALTPGYYNFTNSQAAVINIQGNTPLIKTSAGALSFISATNSFSELSSLSIHGVALSGDITISAPTNFEISTDGIIFYTSLTISGNSITTIYIRYTPTATTLITDQGMLTLTSGGVTQTVSLSGMTYILDCNPPQNAQGTHDNGTAQLSWTAPTQIINTYRFSWDSAAVTYSGYNMSNWTVKAVHRMTESELINFHKKQLTQVSFYARPGGSSYKIVVFKRGSYVNGAFSEGTQIVSQSISSVGTNRWNTITLDTPVDIDANEELWYGVQFTASASSYPLAIGSGTYIPGKGGVIYIDGYGWMEFKNIGAERNFPLKAIFQDAPATITGYTIDRNDVTIGSTTSTSYQDHITTTGTYTYNITANWSNGCSATSDDITMSIVTDCPTLTSDTSANACSSFNWYEYTNLSTSGEYTHTFQNESGCDSVVTLHLTIKHGATSASSVAECGSYLWHDTTYTESGTYIFEYINNEGCPSSDTLHLVINNPVHTGSVAEAVETFVWHREGATDTTITTSGTYTHTHPDDNGCAQTDTLHLTVYHATGTQIDASACESFVWQRPLAGDTTITSSGSYVDNLKNVHGADSVITLVLNIKHGATSASSVAECGSYVWHDTTYTESGTYIFEYINNEGCPSSDTLHLVINNPVHTGSVAEAVETFTWHREGAADTTITTSGTYTHTHPDANGCAQTDTLHLTVYHATNTQINASACESFVWQRPLAGDTTITSSGSYVDNLKDVHGADSVITLILNIKHGATSASSVAECGSYLWHDTTHTESGTYIFEYINNEGCPSSDTLHLVINNPVHTGSVAEAVETFTWHREGAADTTITTSGTYTHTHPDANGCAQTDTLHLTVYHATNTQINASACESFVWQRPLAGDTTLLTSGTYVDNLKDVHGADSVITLVLNIKHGATSASSVAECDSYVWHDTTRTESGTYLFEYLNNEGCPSSDTLHLVINNPVHTGSVAEAVETFTWHREGAADTTITMSGTYTHTHSDANGCAQTDTLYLTVYHATGTQVDASACESFVWQRPLAGDTTLLASGIYRDTLTDVHGADSVITLILNIKHGATSASSVAECDSYVWHDTTRTESGTYIFEYINNEGCPSSDTLHLVINHAVNTSTVEEAVETFVWHREGAADTTITTSGTYTHTHPDANGCAQTDTLHLTVYHATGTQIDTSACEEFIWQRPLAGDTTLLASGIYRDTLTDVHGADSVITLNLTINPSYYIPENVSVMEAQMPYLWHGQTFNESATAFDSLSTVAGCDSVFYLNISVVPYNIIQDNPIALCQGETQVWRGQLLSEQGSYKDTVPAENTIYTVDVTINPTYYFPENVTVMQAEMPYQWHGQTFDESTTAFDSLYTLAGCDSVFYLNLTVTSFTIIQDNPIALCQGETQVWRGQLLSEQGSYSDTAWVENTIYTVVVTVNPTYYFPENVTVMEAQLPYQWHGQAFNESTTAFDSLSTAAGCDSVFYLNLTVVPYNIIQDNPIALCQGETQLWRGHLLFELGIYSDTVPAENTIYTVVVTVRPTYNIQENMSVCESALPFTWHNQTVTGPGIYTDSSQTTFSCDSIHTLSVYVTNVTTQEDSMTVCGEDATYTWHNMTLSETGIYSDTLRNTNGCDSIVYTMNFVKGSPFFSEDSVHLSVVTLPYVWHGMAISDAGVYYDSLQTSVGCDSVYSLQAYYYDWLIVDTPITLCPGDTVFWRMRTITESGTYRDTVFRWGDRFIFSVVVTMGEPFYHNDTVTICQDELPYIWHEQSIDTSGTSILRLQTVAGCDSIYMLTLTVSPSIRQNDTAETCQGTPYAWRGLQLETSGYYVDSVENTSGCEDVYTLLLTVNPTYSVDTAVTITTNDLPYHFVSGQIDTTFATLDSQFSTFNFQFSTIEGCDSVITLNITLNVGIEHHSLENAIKAFPNPTTGQLTVVGSSELTQIQLFDAYGRRVCVYPVEGTQTEIDLHGLASGIYILKAMRHNQMAGTLKIIKNNE